MNFTILDYIKATWLTYIPLFFGTAILSILLSGSEFFWLGGIAAFILVLSGYYNGAFVMKLAILGAKQSESDLYSESKP